MDKKLEKYITYVVNDLFENTEIVHYNKIIKLPFYLSTTSTQFLIDIGYGDYTPRFLSDESIIKYLISNYGIENKEIIQEVWKKYLKRLESDLLKNENVMINENTKKEKLKSIIINDLLEKFPMNRKTRESFYLNEYYQKINDVLSNEYGIDDRKDIEMFKNMFLSMSLDLPMIGTKIELDYTDDPFTNLKSGDTGVVTEYNGTPWGWQLGVKWDNGSSLQLIPDIDKWKVLS
jgi:hypothetical protein